MDNQKDYDRDNEIVPFIGIQRKYVNIASKVYSILFLGYAAWIFTRKFLNSSKILEDRLEGIWAHLAGFSIVEGVVMIAIIQIGDIAMYLTSKFKMKVKKQVEAAEAKGRAEGEAKGRAEGEAKGRAEGEGKKAEPKAIDCGQHGTNAEWKLKSKAYRSMNPPPGTSSKHKRYTGLRPTSFHTFGGEVMAEIPTITFQILGPNEGVAEGSSNGLWFKLKSEPTPTDDLVVALKVCSANGEVKHTGAIMILKHESHSADFFYKTVVGAHDVQLEIEPVASLG